MHNLILHHGIKLFWEFGLKKNLREGFWWWYFFVCLFLVLGFFVGWLVGFFPIGKDLSQSFTGDAYSSMVPLESQPIADK